MTPYSLLGFLLMGTVFFCLFLLAAYLGFRAGRMSIDKPLPPLREQTTGEPVLAQYDPYADAMGEDQVEETVK